MKLSDYKDEIKEKVNIETEEIKEKVNIEKETIEAKLAGEAALLSLKKAKENLNSARNWGIYDLVGGGFFSSLVKHSKMNDANQYILDAKNKLDKFARELKDVESIRHINLDTSDLVGFSDVFFDNILADVLMQDRINKARNQIDEIIYKVEGIICKL